MEKDKTLEEINAEIAEKFANTPYLIGVFQQFETDIRRYNHYHWKEGVTKEKVIEKRDRFLTVLKEMRFHDLLVLYYLRSIEGLSAWKTALLLQKRYKAQCEFKNEIEQTDKYTDIWEIMKK